jgi:hypothetical protein
MVQVFQMSIDELSTIIKDAVATELQKMVSLSKPKEETNVFLTREETAKLLNVSTTTLYLWNRDKILEHTKLNRRVYYSRNEVYNKLNLQATA